MHNLQYTYYELMWLFLLYSFFGWCTGVVVSAVKRKKFINTGVLNLPVCPVYGVAAVAYSVILVELKHRFFFLFLGGVVIGAFLTVMTGIILEGIFHRKWWVYKRFQVGLGGYVTLPLLLLYGAAAVLALWVFNPLFLKILRLIPHSIGRVVLLNLMILLLLDLLGTLAVVWRWRVYIKRMSGVTDNMQRVSESFGNAITNAVRRRLERSYPNIETEKIKKTKENEAKRGTERKFAEGTGFYKLFWLFVLGSFFGDIVETVFCRFSLGEWMSRSSLIYGQFSVIWGFACSILTVMLYKYRDKSDRYLFIYGTIVGGTYEYVCSVMAEIVFGASFWDYSKIPFNLGGRINLLFCFFWGIVAVFWVKGAYPFLSKWIEKIPRKIGPVITWIVVVLMVADMGISMLALVRYSERQLGAAPSNRIEQFLDQQYPDELMKRVYPKAKVVR